MKKLLFLIMISSLFGKTLYQGKVIGDVKIGNGVFGSKYLKVYCINGVQYMGSLTYYKTRSSLTPVYNPNGSLKTCK